MKCLKSIVNYPYNTVDNDRPTINIRIDTALLNQKMPGQYGPNDTAQYHKRD